MSTTPDAVQSLWKHGQNWMRPRASDPEAAFRERTIRGMIPILSAFLIIGGVMVLIDREYPILFMFGIIGLIVFGAGLAVERDRLDLAAFLLFLFPAVAAVGSELDSGYLSTGGLVMSLFYVLFGAVVLPRQFVRFLPFVMIIIYSAIALLVGPRGLSNTPDAPAGFQILEVTILSGIFFGIGYYWLTEFERRRLALAQLVETLEERVAARTRDLETSAAVSRSVSTLLNRDELLSMVVERTRTSFGLQSTAIYLKEGSRLTLTARSGQGGLKESILLDNSNDTDVRVNAARTRTPILSNNLPMQTEYAIPIQFMGELLGIFYVLVQQTSKFNADDQGVLAVLAEQTGIAIRNAQLFQTAKESRQTAELLAEISDRLGRVNSEDDILNALTPFTDLYNVSFSALLYMREDRQSLNVVAVRRWDGEILSTVNPATLPIQVSAFPMTTSVVANNKPAFVPDVDLQPDMAETERAALRRNGIRAHVQIPLKSTDRWQGILTLAWDQPTDFSPNLKQIVFELMPRLADGIAARRAYLEAQAARTESDRQYRISKAMNSASTYVDLLSAVASVIGPQAYTMYLGIYEGWDASKAAYINAVAVVPPQTDVASPLNTRIAAPTLRAKNGERITHITDTYDLAQIDAEQSKYLMSLNVRALLSTLIYVGERLVGTLSFASETPYTFNADEIRLIRNVSEVAALAIERARLYDEQVALVEQLREVDRMKSQFLASMSHELRTPMNAILNFTDFVAKGIFGPVNNEQIDALNKAIESGKHLLSLINDVLDVAKIQAGVMQLFIEPDCDILSEIESVTTIIRPALQDKPVELIQDIDRVLPRLPIDRRRTRQVLLNLLANAVKFTHQGSITLSVKNRDAELLIAVIDTGPGIDPKDQTTIFEPFRQSEVGLRQGSGTGLGLYISRQLIEAHGGKLWVESELGDGAAFYLTLPVRNIESVSKAAPAQ
jgi:signal transduction histidine kinase